MKFLKPAVIVASAALILLSNVSNVYAAANCAGKVKLVLKFPTQCGGKLAFNMADGSEFFYCTQDNTEAALVLTAQASGAEMIIRLANSNLTLCSQNTTQYTTPRYMIVTSPE